MWPGVNPGSSPVAGALEIVHLDSLHSLSILLRDFLTWELWLLRRFMNGLGSPMNPWDCIESRCHDQLVGRLHSGGVAIRFSWMRDPHKFNQ